MIKILCRIFCICVLVLFSIPLTASTSSNYDPVSISTDTITNFNANSPKVKKIIETGLELARHKLGYRYGSADPKLGGMDCSGTIYYLLTQMGITPVPRSSSTLYQWVIKEGKFHRVQNNSLKTPDFSNLKPGDLLFWSGTYNAPQNAYATHVMIYIGKNKQGAPLMLGSSNGRTYQGKRIYGASVFDFVMPPPNSNSKFIGYSCIPHLSC